MGEPVANNAVEGEVTPDFRMTARVPAPRLGAAALACRRPRAPSPPPIPAPTLPPREQRLLIRLVKALHEAGVEDLGRIDERGARPVAERVVHEFCAEENEVFAPEERALIVEAILNEALRGS